MLVSTRVPWPKRHCHSECGHVRELLEPDYTSMSIKKYLVRTRTIPLEPKALHFGRQTSEDRTCSCFLGCLVHLATSCLTSEISGGPPTWSLHGTAARGPS